MAGVVHNLPAAPFKLPKRMTSAEYWALPEDAPRCELVGGVVHMAPAPDSWHQDITGDLYSLIKGHLAENDLGKVYFAPFGMSLPDDTELQPDLLVLGKGHPQLGVRSRSITHPPLLVIEILSPSTRTHDKRRKFRLYESFGVPHYWIVDPSSRTIEAWSLVDGAYEFSAGATAPEKRTFPPFPELVLELDELMPKVG